MSGHPSEAIARQYARIALGHVACEYPNKLDHVMGDGDDAQTPRALHPVFFGSFDWHSCVHSWWLLLRVRRMFPTTPEAARIKALARATFTAEKLAAELAYIERPLSRGFERPYGWAWLLALHHEAAQHKDMDWGDQLAPIAHALSGRMTDYLEVLTYPIFVGTHFNTAFALILARQWAQSHDHGLLENIDRYARQAFYEKRDYAGWEPGGDEFLSPVLCAALLMSAVLQEAEFAPWFERLVIDNGWLQANAHPVHVSDRTDGKIAHLDGLNLSRAWCLWGVGRALDGGLDPAIITLLRQRAAAHFDAANAHVAGDYMGEHWLASFALLAQLERG